MGAPSFALFAKGGIHQAPPGTTLSPWAQPTTPNLSSRQLETLSSRPKWRDLHFAFCHPTHKLVIPTGVEGPAFRLLPPYPQTCHPDRSGGTCISPFATLPTNLSSRPKWRDLHLVTQPPKWVPHPSGFCEGWDPPEAPPGATSSQPTTPNLSSRPEWRDLHLVTQPRKWVPHPSRLCEGWDSPI
jgi:hypothetical protein